MSYLFCFIFGSVRVSVVRSCNLYNLSLKSPLQGVSIIKFIFYCSCLSSIK